MIHVDVEIYGLNGTKLSYIDRINLLKEFGKSTTSTPGSGKDDEDLSIANRIIVEPISNKKDGQNIGNEY